MRPKAYSFFRSLWILLLVPFIFPGVAAAERFVFGNHIDTHQATAIRVKNNEPQNLAGVFYILFTGDRDPVSGLPIARHPRGASAGEACGVDVDCEVGWIISALPGEAKFLFHTGVNGEDHPVWLVNRVQIPQPGGYTHFHWITSASNDPRAAQVPQECQAETAGALEGVAENVTCPGWLMQITAVQSI